MFEYLTESYSLLESPLDDLAIMGIIGVVAFAVAYAIVGWFYDMGIIAGREAGSFLHWTIRAIVFVAIYYVIATAIRIYNWVIGVPVHIWIISGVAIVGIIMAVSVTKNLVQEKRYAKRVKVNCQNNIEYDN